MMTKFRKPPTFYYTQTNPIVTNPCRAEGVMNPCRSEVVMNPCRSEVVMNPCRAAGVLFYTFKKGKLKLLLQSSDKGWVDLGGKTENGDADIITTAAREASEESNCALITPAPLTSRNDVVPLIPACTQHIKRKLQQSKCKKIYIKQSKYLLFLVHLPSFEARHFTQSKLLDRELFYEDDMYKRTIGWKSINTFKELAATNALHPRLRHAGVYDEIEALKRSAQ